MTLPHRVSYVTADRDDTVLVAMGVMVDDHTIRWFDTVKERVMTIARIVDASPDHFIFERTASEGGGTYTFVPMTLERYRSHVWERLVLKREFDDEASMLAAFEQTQSEVW